MNPLSPFARLPQADPACFFFSAPLFERWFFFNYLDLPFPAMALFFSVHRPSDFNVALTPPTAHTLEEERNPNVPRFFCFFF